MILLLTKHRFFLLTPGGECSNFASFNAGSLTDRLKIFSVVINIFRVMLTLEKFLPKDTYPLYLNLTRLNGGSVSLMALF